MVDVVWIARYATNSVMNRYVMNRLQTTETAKVRNESTSDRERYSIELCKAPSIVPAAPVTV